MKNGNLFRMALSVVLLSVMAMTIAFAQDDPSGRPDMGELNRQGEAAAESLRSLEAFLEGEGQKMDLRIALVEAVKKDDLAAFRAAEAKGADIKYVQPETGETILMIASYWGALDCVKYLIKEGLDPRRKSVTGETSIHCACMLDRPHVGSEYAPLRKKKAAVIRYYMSAGYNKPGDLSWLVVWNVAHLAAGSDNPEALEALKASDVDIDAPMGPLQIRPLAYAAERARLETVKTLVKLGSRVSAETGYGMTALDEAINGENEPVVEYLTSIGAKRGAFAALIAEATEEGEREAREAQAEYDAQVGLPLIQACWDGDLARIKELIAGGMDPNVIAMGTTPLIASIGPDLSPDQVRFLLSKGAKPNLATEEGKTALVMASILANPTLVKILLAAGADPNLGMGGLPPIEFARMSESPEVEALLKKAGARD